MNMSGKKGTHICLASINKSLLQISSMCALLSYKIISVHPTIKKMQCSTFLPTPFWIDPNAKLDHSLQFTLQWNLSIILFYPFTEAKQTNFILFWEENMWVVETLAFRTMDTGPPLCVCVPKSLWLEKGLLPPP